MNLFANIWNHPKTSAAGLLIAVVSIAGVLSQQGVTLGKAGTGTVVSLASALATALLGLLAKDPEAASQQVGAPASQRGGASRPSAKLGAWLLIALTLSATLPSHRMHRKHQRTTVGCNHACLSIEESCCRDPDFRRDRCQQPEDSSGCAYGGGAERNHRAGLGTGSECGDVRG